MIDYKLYDMGLSLSVQADINPGWSPISIYSLIDPLLLMIMIEKPVNDLPYDLSGTLGLIFSYISPDVRLVPSGVST